MTTWDNGEHYSWIANWMEGWSNEQLAPLPKDLLKDLYPDLSPVHETAQKLLDSQKAAISPDLIANLYAPSNELAEKLKGMSTKSAAALMIDIPDKQQLLRNMGYKPEMFTVPTGVDLSHLWKSIELPDVSAQFAGIVSDFPKIWDIVETSATLTDLSHMAAGDYIDELFAEYSSPIDDAIRDFLEESDPEDVKTIVERATTDFLRLIHLPAEVWAGYTNVQKAGIIGTTLGGFRDMWYTMTSGDGGVDTGVHLLSSIIILMLLLYSIGPGVNQLSSK